MTWGKVDGHIEINLDAALQEVAGTLEKLENSAFNALSISTYRAHNVI